MNRQQNNPSISEWDFGSDPILAHCLEELVLKGKKTATCGLFNGPTPKPGDTATILQSDGTVACYIQYLTVEVKPLSEVSEEFIKQEGEGEMSKTQWLEHHLQIFKSWNESGVNINEHSLAVFETFTRIDNPN